MRNTELRFGLFVLSSFSAVVLIATACSDSGDSEESPTPTIASDRTLLESMALTQQDVPAYLQRTSAVFSTNEEAVSGLAEAEQRLAEYDEWGRLLGYTTTFIPIAEGGPVGVSLGVESQVNLYVNEEGASLAYEDRAISARQQVVELQNAPTPDDASSLQIDEIDGGEIGDERYWVRTSQVIPGDVMTLRVDNQILFRVGRVQAFLRADAVIEGGTDRTAYTEDVREWAQLMSDRIANTLAVGATS